MQGGKDAVDEESSSEDEIEKAARITPETPTSGNRWVKGLQVDRCFVK